MSTRTRILSGVAALAVIAAGVIGVAAVGAQEGGDAQLARGEVFVQRVADNLGVTTDALKGAVKDAQLAGVDDALAAGRITDDQATKLRDKINSSEGLGLRALIKHHDRKQERRGEIRRAFVETAAESIGITPDELREQLAAGTAAPGRAGTAAPDRAGASIADVAAANGASVDDVKADILAAASTKLDAAVANGRLTQVRADEMLQKLTDNIDDILAKQRG